MLDGRKWEHFLKCSNIMGWFFLPIHESRWTARKQSTHGGGGLCICWHRDAGRNGFSPRWSQRWSNARVSQCKTTTRWPPCPPFSQHNRWSSLTWMNCVSCRGNACNGLHIQNDTAVTGQQTQCVGLGLPTTCVPFCIYERTHTHTHTYIKETFTLQPAIKAQKRSTNISTLSLTASLDRGGWLTPRPGRLPPGKGAGTQYIGDWVGPRAGLEECEKFLATGIRSLYHPTHSESLYSLSYPGTHTHMHEINIELNGFCEWDTLQSLWLADMCIAIVQINYKLRDKLLWRRWRATCLYTVMCMFRITP
jgi:hypothetical protein